MESLKRGINKVPGVKGGEIHISGDSPSNRRIKIKLPEASPITNLLKSPEEDQYDLSNKFDRQSPLIEENIRQNILEQMAGGVMHQDMDESKAKQFKRLDSIRERIMKTQDAIDMMVDRAAYEHPGIAEDLKQGTKNYFNEFRTRYPEYDELQQNLRDYQDEYMNDPLHDEHFENALNKLRSKA